MSSVKNYLRRQADVNHFPPNTSRAKNHNLNSPEVERPLSEYDNLTSTSQFPDIKFRFDDNPPSTTMSSSQTNSNNNNNNNNNNNTSIPSHTPKYENIIDTVQMRAKRENDQRQVKMDHDDDNNRTVINRPVISEAKSSFFFGLNQAPSSSHKNENNGTTTTVNNNNNDDDLEKLIEDCANIKIVSSSDIQQYVNFISGESEKVSPVSATSSASGSSAVTASPSASPTREERKNSEAGSNRSKSPKFILPPRTPSQAVYMSTTVPQNIKGQNIMGRHKPTRNSLRHSRLIVKNFQVHPNSNFLNIKHVWLAKFVLALKIFIGASLVALGAWICLFANSTPLSQNPFWSGLSMIASAFLGLYLMSFRIKSTRSRLKKNFFWFLKMNASILIILSVFLTTLALIYATFHYVSLTSDNKNCFPENVFVNSSSCICIFNVNKNVILSKEFARDDSEGLMDSNGHIDIPENSNNVVHFRDLSCNELGTWSHILLTSMILNFIGLLLCVCYLTQFIFGCKKRKKRNYVSVRNGA